MYQTINNFDLHNGAIESEEMTDSITLQSMTLQKDDKKKNY